MRSIISRWFMFGLLLGWALTHATVFGQPATVKVLSAPEKLRFNLDKSVTLDFTGQSLTDVLNHFREKTGIPINVDQMAMMQMGMNDGGFPGGPPGGGGGAQIQLKANNEKASQVLRKLLNSHQLAYIIFEDAVLVSTEEAALMRQMRQRVSVDLEDVPLNKAVRNLAKTHGLNLVIDPIVKMESERQVSLQLENTGIETTLRLLAEMASLKAVRMGNVMFITSEEKAKKLRQEEPQQLDNPFNPHLPMGQQIIRGGFGLGGGFGGVMAIPPRAAPPIPLGAPPRANVPQAAPIPLDPLPPPKGGAVPPPPVANPVPPPVIDPFVPR